MMATAARQGLKTTPGYMSVYCNDGFTLIEKLIPAVTHVDGTGRVQTVTREGNGSYYDLICEYKRLTGIPVILNTSFNSQEPIVCSPMDAVRTFCGTGLDYLVMGRFVVGRKASKP